MLPPEPVRQFIDKQVGLLARARFTPDPLLGSFSELASILGSAPKRHGAVIELAICEALRDSGVYRFWRRVKFAISANADLITSQAAEQCQGITLPYGGGRVVQTDLIAYHLPSSRIGAYEIKRGNGHHDAGKIRSLRRDVFGTQMVIASYARRDLMLTVGDAISRAIFYYGKRSLPAPWSLIGAELDGHFGCPVRAIVESATAYFHTRLAEFLDQVETIRPDMRQLALQL